jgi:hypothetical protein
VLASRLKDLPIQRELDGSRTSLSQCIGRSPPRHIHNPRELMFTPLNPETLRQIALKHCERYVNHISMLLVVPGFAG